jgi:hypothetical protein
LIPTGVFQNQAVEPAVRLSETARVKGLDGAGRHEAGFASVSHNRMPGNRLAPGHAALLTHLRAVHTDPRSEPQFMV